MGPHEAFDLNAYGLWHAHLRLESFAGYVALDRMPADEERIRIFEAIDAQIRDSVFVPEVLGGAKDLS